MRYYVVSDIHGFFSPLQDALNAAGFFSDLGPHKLIVCGDIMDRGAEAKEVELFLYDLLQKNQLLLVKGNHEDFMEDLVQNFEANRLKLLEGTSYHIRNGTLGTALQISGMSFEDALFSTQEFLRRVKSSIFYRELIPACVNYFEEGNYIFVHGWIPCEVWGRYRYRKDWRDSSNAEWYRARWKNGIEMAELRSIIELGKTIVCGHWHTSWGHSILERKGSEFGPDADFSPYQSKGILALDACTALSGKVNCVVLEIEREG